jgi:diguanylate cyclase (GGDEF)-like protein
MFGPGQDKASMDHAEGTPAMGLQALDRQPAPSRQPKVFVGGRRWISSSFRTGHALVLLSILVVAAICGTAAFMITHNRQSAIKDHLRAMDSMGVVLVEQTSRYVQLIDLLVEEVQSKIADLHTTTPAGLRSQLEVPEFKSYLTERAKRVSQVETIAVIDADGRVMNWSRAEPVGQRSASSRDYYGYFKDHSDPALFIGQVSKSIVTGKLDLYFARRISGPDGRFVGVVLAVVDISYLSDFYRAAGEKLDETIALLRNDGSMLIRYPNPELAIGLKLSLASPWYEIARRGGGSYTSVATLKGTPSLVSVHLLRDYPLVIDILMDETAVFAQWRREALTIFYFALTASLAFVGLFWILGRQFRRLSESAILLSEGKQILSTYAEMSADWFWEQDADFRFKFCTDLPFMIAPNDVGKTRRELGDPAMAEERWITHEADLAAGRPFRNFRWERIGSDGEPHFLSTSGDPIIDRGGNLTGYRGTGRDVTAEIRATARLAEANARLAQANSDLELGRQQFDAVLSNISQGVCFFSAEKRLRLCNQRYAEIYKLPPEATQAGQSLRAVMMFRSEAGSGSDLSVGDYLVWWDHIAALKQSGTSVVTLQDGRVISLQYQFMRDGGWVATHEDITDRHQFEASILFMARHDALTKLPNRVVFRERMEDAISMTGRGTKFAVFCLDLDKFKQVNDNFGHPMGDALLVAVADRLRACVREVDTIARLGGDEFAIIQISLGQPDDAEVLASRIIAAFREPFDLDGHQITSGVSLGIAVAPEDGVSYEGLMRDADTALYLAKAEHCGVARFFEPEMDARIHLRRLLEQDLEGALAREEFELYYQPQVSLTPNRVSGFEALLRWNHPIRGLISPLEFIQVAEETELIVAIGKWALRTACAEAQTWPRDVSVAVNLSSIQFRGDIVATVREALDASGLQSERLELEITESVFLTAAADTMVKLRDLRALGISVALDDFGTGYSSLSYLRTFAVSKIKIDQSFIRDLTTSKESVSIVRAVTGLGQSLGMMTIAEGVETQEQVNELRALGCTEVQGYFFGRPRPASEVSAVLDRFKQEPMAPLTAGWNSSTTPATSTTAVAIPRS